MSHLSLMALLTILPDYSMLGLTSPLKTNMGKQYTPLNCSRVELYLQLIQSKRYPYPIQLTEIMTDLKYMI